MHFNIKLYNYFMNFLSIFRINNIFKLWIQTLIFLIISMIIVGGLTRLTGSGLSITQWNLFDGIIPPLNVVDWNYYFSLYKNIPQYKLINYNITLLDFKTIYLWEYFHRLLGRIIGIVYLIPLIYFIYIKKITTQNLKLFIFIFFLICLQGFLGWYMVQSGLVDDITVSHYRLSVHLITAFIILSILVWIYLNMIRAKKNLSIFYFNSFPLKIFILLIFMQIIMGAFVSGLDAGNIYQTWPLMNGFYLPNDITFNNISIFFDFNNQSLVQFYHRNIAYVILILYFYIGITIYKKKSKNLYSPYLYLLVIIILQIILGVSTLLSGVNVIVASLHQISSIFLVIFSLNLYHSSLNNF